MGFWFGSSLLLGSDVRGDRPILKVVRFVERYLARSGPERRDIEHDLYS